MDGYSFHIILAVRKITKIYTPVIVKLSKYTPQASFILTTIVVGVILVNIVKYMIGICG